MSEQKHTPGPWKMVEMGSYSVTCDAEAYDMVGVGLNDGYPLAITVSRNPLLNRAEANAHLIAAAPELLEALKDCLDRFVTAFPAAQSYEPIQRGYKAIAKAEGK